MIATCSPISPLSLAVSSATFLWLPLGAIAFTYNAPSNLVCCTPIKTSRQRQFLENEGIGWIYASINLLELESILNHLKKIAVQQIYKGRGQGNRRDTEPPDRRQHPTMCHAGHDCEIQVWHFIHIVRKGIQKKRQVATGSMFWANN